MKYCGYIGFVETIETAPSVWKEVIIRRKYFGEISRIQKRFRNGEGINDNIEYSNKLSIVADPYILNNLQSIRYIEWLNVKWKISNVEVAYPRLNLEIGGVYNEE